MPLLLLAFLMSWCGLTSCGHNNTLKIPLQYLRYDPIFQQEVSLYFAMKGAGPSYALEIQMADELSAPGAVGICRKHSGSTFRFIQIKRSGWERLSLTARRGLIFHELGHCDLDLPHKKTYREDGQPMSFMHPQVFTHSEADFFYYANELFGYGSLNPKIPGGTL